MALARKLAFLLLGLSGCAQTAPDEGRARAEEHCLVQDDVAARYFEIVDPEVCIVARYEVTATPSSIGLAGFTWGRHGGPLRGPNEAAGTRPSIVRYDVPSASTGSLIATETIIATDGVPSGARWFPAVVDHPSRAGTALSYTTGPFDGRDPGGIIIVDGDRALESYPVLGGAYLTFQTSALVHASYAPLGVGSLAPGEAPRPGVYLAERCGESGYTAASASCIAPHVLFEWDYDGGCCNTRPSVVGPTATDANGNIFGRLSDEARLAARTRTSSR